MTIPESAAAVFEREVREALAPTYRFCQSKALTAKALGHEDRPWLDVLLNLDAIPAKVAAQLATALAQPDGEEALEACREQRGDLLELLKVERGQHADALVKAWHEGYGAGSSDVTDGWLKSGSPRTACPYLLDPDAQGADEGGGS